MRRPGGGGGGSPDVRIGEEDDDIFALDVVRLALFRLEEGEGGGDGTPTAPAAEDPLGSDEATGGGEGRHVLALDPVVDERSVEDFRDLINVPTSWSVLGSGSAGRLREQ